MSVREEINTRWITALSGVKFPVSSWEEIYAGFPEGMDHNITFQGLVICHTGELLEKFLKPTDFPIKSAEELSKLVLDRAGF